MDMIQIESEALSLSAEQRASLAHRLLLSLEEATGPEFDRLWAEESIRRAADADAGSTQSIPADEVAQNARELLR